MKILHLYHDLMNLYGEYANVSALSKILSSNGLEHTVDRLSLGDKLSLLDYDVIYVGSGTEQAQKLALAHLTTYKKELEEYIKTGGFALFTGNSFEMLGEKITSPSGEYDGLGIFGFTTEETEKRLTSDAIFTLNDMTLVGFINKCSLISGVESPLFEVKMGLGNSTDENTEGLVSKNLFATHLTGPILVKNPCFLQYFASKLAEKELSLDAFSYEKSAYEITKNKLEERNER